MGPFDYTLYFDCESFSPTPIRDGVHRYAESAEIMVATWAIDDGPVQTEDLVVIHAGGEVSCRPPSDELRRHLLNPRCEAVIANSAFDRTMIRHCWGIDLPTERIHDTMIQALAHGLPGSLDKLCEIFKLDDALAKSKDGHALIQLFCKPLGKNSKIRRATRISHSDKWAAFLAYAGSDILAMRELKRLMPTWNLTERERALWRLDQKINDRGFAVDLDLARAAIEAVNTEQARLKKRTGELTGGAPPSTTQRDALLAHILQEYGVSLPDMAKDTLERRLADETLPEALRELLRIRLSATTTSTAKYAALKRSVSSDGRLRGTIQFCGASRTFRDAGRILNPQNLLRPDMDQQEIDLAIQAFVSGAWDLVLDDPIRAAANAMRGVIQATEGKKIVSSDLSNIEGRVGAWLSGEQWKLDAFADYDVVMPEGEGYQQSDGSWRKGPDLYVLAYSKAFGVGPILVDKTMRLIGKVMELALLFGGGVGAFLSFAEIYRIDLEEMARNAISTLPTDARAEAERMLVWRKRKGITTYGLSDLAYVVCQAFVSMWREAHPATASYWPEIEAAAKKAIQNPGVEVVARKLKFLRQGAWLRMMLPTNPEEGHSVCYPSPRIEDGKISYLGVSQYTRKFERIGTHGSKTFENAVQAVARDVMFYNKLKIEDAGFEIILPVHDELNAEAPLNKPHLTAELLSALLSKNPPWLEGCPLSASGFEAQRYRKG